jgi:hypothetical protein
MISTGAKTHSATMAQQSPFTASITKALGQVNFPVRPKTHRLTRAHYESGEASTAEPWRHGQVIRSHARLHRGLRSGARGGIAPARLPARVRRKHCSPDFFHSRQPTPVGAGAEDR